MERKEFLSKLGIGVAAVCAGCSIVSCGGSKSSNPSPVVNPPQKGEQISIDLNSDLINIGDSKVEDGVIVVRLAADNTAASFTAVQVACTHEGTAINYNSGQGIFICPLHGSEFSKSGAVLQGPAARSLQEYNVKITGSTLTVAT